MVGYPYLDMHAQSLTALTPMSIHVIADGTAAVFFDLDSISWEYCSKSWHTAQYSYKRDKDEKKLLKVMNIGVTAANNWGWG